MLVLVLALLTLSTTVDALAAQQRWWAPAADVHATLRVEDAYVSLNGAGSIRSQIFGVTAYEGGSVFDCPEKDVCPVGCTTSASNSPCCSTPQTSEDCAGTQWLREWGVSSVGAGAGALHCVLPHSVAHTKLIRPRGEQLPR